MRVEGAGEEVAEKGIVEIEVDEEDGGKEEEEEEEELEAAAGEEEGNERRKVFPGRRIGGANTAWDEPMEEAYVIASVTRDERTTGRKTPAIWPETD